MINKHYEAIHRYDFLTKELLEEEYIKNKLNDSEIAKKYNMPSKTVVWRKRKNFGIDNRYKNKSNKNAEINRKFDISEENARKLLKDGLTYKKIAEIMGCSKQVVKRRFEELGFVDKQNHVSHYKFFDIVLTEKQKQLVVGSVLGDGTITVSGAYSCSHSIKQKEYFDYKRNILFNLHSNHVHQYTHDYSYLSEPTDSIHFTTGCNKYLYEMRSIFYPNGIKIFPYEFILKNMDLLGLSFWYCDDGGIKQASSNLYTYGYSYEEQNKMVYLFKEKFGIEPVIRMDNARKIHKYHLAFNVKDSRKFIDLISPHILPCMRYKIDYNAYLNKIASEKNT